MRCKSIFLAVLVILCFQGMVFSGGWDNSLIGARAAGMAAAFVGLADDATAIFYNPAGLSFTAVNGEFLICGKKYYPTHSYTNMFGQKGTSENPTSLFEMFTYYHFSQKLTIGLGAYTPYAGGGIRWSQKDVGFDIEGDIGVIAISPTISYKLSESFALGLNIHGYYIVSNQKYHNQATQPTSINAEETDFIVSFSGGLLFKPGEKWSFGITYHGPTDVNLTGNTETDGFKVNSETKFYLPFSAGLGFAYHLTPQLTLVSEFDYFRWSKLPSLKKVIHSPAPIGEIIQVEKLGFKDNYYLKLGGEYQLSKKLIVRLGTSYDKGAVPRESLSLTNIDVDKINFLGGFTYHWGGYDFNFAGFYAIGQEQSVPISPNVTMPGNFNLDARGILISINRTF